MNFSQKFDVKKLFSAVRFFDGLPLVHEDLHQLQDKERFARKTMASRLAYQGILDSPDISVEGGQLVLRKSVLNLEGDFFVIQSSDGILEIPIPANTGGGSRTDTVVLEGFFKEVTATSTLKEYGGLNNSTISNDLTHQGTGIQVSTRYQFQWRVRILEGITDLTKVNAMTPTGLTTTTKYQGVEDEPFLFEVVDPALETVGNKQYLFRLATVNVPSGSFISTGDVTLPNNTKVVDQNLLEILQNEVSMHNLDRNNPHGVTADQIGAVKSSGDEMSGPLTILGSDALTSLTLSENADIKKIKQQLQQLEINTYNLFLENYYEGKLTNKAGMQFDGFVDSLRADIELERLEVDVAAGSTTIKVSSARNFLPGQQILIYDDINIEEATISDVDKVTKVLTLTAGLKNGYSVAKFTTVTRTNVVFDRVNRQIHGGYLAGQIDQYPIQIGANTYGHVFYPRHVVDKDGVKHMVFDATGFDQDYYNIGYVKVLPTGETSEVAWLTRSAGYHSYRPAIDIDNEGELSIVFHSTLNPINSSYNNVGLITISPIGEISGVRWLTNETAHHNHHADIKIASDGTKNVVFHGTAFNGNNNIGLIRITPANEQQPTVWVTKDAAHNYCPTLAIDELDNLHMTWHSTAFNASYNNISYVVVETNDKVSARVWLTESTAASSDCPRIAYRNGKKVVVFHSSIYAPGYNVAAVVIDDKGRPNPIKWLTESSTMDDQNYFPDVTLGSEGTAQVVFHSTGLEVGYNYANIVHMSLASDGTLSARNYLTQFKWTNLQSQKAGRYASITMAANDEDFEICYSDNTYSSDYNNLGRLRLTSSGEVTVHQIVTKFRTHQESKTMGDIVIDSKGNKYVFVQSQLYRSFYHNVGYIKIAPDGTFSDIVWVTRYNGNSTQNIRAVIDKNDVIHITFLSYQQHVSYQNLAYVKWDTNVLTDIGISTGRQVPDIEWVTTGTVHRYSPDIAIGYDPEGRTEIHFVWDSREYTTDDYNIMYRKKKGDGTWLGIVTVTTDNNATYAYDNRQPKVVVDTLAVAHIFYQSYAINTGSIWNVRYSRVLANNTPQGHWWMTSNTSYSSYNVYAAIDASNNKHVIFQSQIYNNSYWNVGHVKVLDGATSGTLGWLTEGVTGHTYPTDARMAPNGDLYAGIHSTIANTSGDNNIGFVSLPAATGIVTPIQWITDQSDYNVHSYDGKFVLESDGSQFFSYLSNRDHNNYFEVKVRSYKAGTRSKEVTVLESKTIQTNSYVKAIEGPDGTLHCLSHGMLTFNSCNWVHYFTIKNGVVSRPTPILREAFHQYNKDLVMDADGVIHVVFEGRRPYTSYTKIVYMTIQPDGTFSAPINMTTDAVDNSQLPRIAITSDGRKHVVFHAMIKNSSYYDIAYMTIEADNTTVSPIMWLTAGGNTKQSYRPDIVVAPDDSIHVVFHSQFKTANVYNIAYVNVTPEAVATPNPDGSIGTLVWLTDQTSASYESLNVDLDVCGDGLIHIVFQSEIYNTTYYNIAYMTITPGATPVVSPITWLTRSTTFNNQEPRVHCGPNGEVRVIFQTKDPRGRSGYYNPALVEVDNDGEISPIQFIAVYDTNVHSYTEDFVVDSKGTNHMFYRSNFYNGTWYSYYVRMDRMDDKGVPVMGKNLLTKKSVYYSKRTTYPTFVKSALMNITRDVGTSTFLATPVSSGSTTIDIQSAKDLAVGDTIEIYENGVRERIVIQGIQVNRLTLAEPVDSDFTASALVERVSVIPEIFFGNPGDSEKFIKLNWKSTAILSGATREDTYEVVHPTGGYDVVAKLNLTKNERKKKINVHQYGLILSI